MCQKKKQTKTKRSTLHHITSYFLRLQYRAQSECQQS